MECVNSPSLDASLAALATLGDAPPPSPPSTASKYCYVALPVNPESLVSPKARLAGLCQALGYARSPSYEVVCGETSIGFKGTVCLFPPPHPQAELRLHCPTLCLSKRDAELAVANQALAILLRPCSS